MDVELRAVGIYAPKGMTEEEIGDYISVGLIRYSPILKGWMVEPQFEREFRITHCAPELEQ